MAVPLGLGLAGEEGYTTRDKGLSTGGWVMEGIPTECRGRPSADQCTCCVAVLRWGNELIIKILKIRMLLLFVFCYTLSTCLVN